MGTTAVVPSQSTEVFNLSGTGAKLEARQQLRLARPRLWLRRRLGWLLPRLLHVRRQDRVQRVAFLPRTEFDDPFLADVLYQALENLASKAGARHFAPPEEYRCLDLVALAQKTQYVVLLGLIVMVVHVDAELHFLDRDRLLVLFGLALFLLLLIEIFPIVHDAANRRLRCGGNLYKVEVTFAGHLERFVRRQDADLLAFIVDHADFARPNTLVCADKSLIDTKPPFTFNGMGIEKYSMPAFGIQHSASATRTAPAISGYSHTSPD